MNAHRVSIAQAETLGHPRAFPSRVPVFLRPPPLPSSTPSTRTRGGDDATRAEVISASCRARRRAGRVRERAGGRCAVRGGATRAPSPAVRAEGHRARARRVLLRGAGGAERRAVFLRRIHRESLRDAQRALVPPLAAAQSSCGVNPRVGELCASLVSEETRSPPPFRPPFSQPLVLTPAPVARAAPAASLPAAPSPAAPSLGPAGSDAGTPSRVACDAATLLRLVQDGCAGALRARALRLERPRKDRLADACCDRLARLDARAEGPCFCEPSALAAMRAFPANFRGMFAFAAAPETCGVAVRGGSACAPLPRAASGDIVDAFSPSSSIESSIESSPMSPMTWPPFPPYPAAPPAPPRPPGRLRRPPVSGANSTIRMRRSRATRASSGACASPSRWMRSGRTGATRRWLRKRRCRVSVDRRARRADRVGSTRTRAASSWAC